ncbi:MAG: type II 3-dehydroquinate dehydratase [Acidimicrobiia bacterium]
MRVLILHGPNLNLLGARQPEIYGSMTLAQLEERIIAWGTGMGLDTSFVQTNSEGSLIDAIQESETDALLINPGALTHTSRAIGDAILARGLPTVEVHISDIYSREPWRSVSLIAASCVRSIVGRGIGGYRDALRHLVNRSAVDTVTIAYGPTNDHVAELRRPVGEPIGAVVLIHGGFWLRQWERDGLESLAVDLTRRGFLTWNVEYRRLGTGGGWPGSAHDVETAIGHLTRELPALGHLNLLGHSAGGYLAQWAGGRRPLSVRTSVVGLAAVTDLSLLAANEGPGSREAQTLLDSGAPPRISPRGDTILIHGEADELVPVAQATRMEDAVDVEVVSGLGHFDLLDPARAHWEGVVSRLMRTG